MTRCPPDVDVIHPRTYAVGGYPHEAWARLRREAPLARVEQEGFDPFWAVTRHADVKWFSKQPDRFLNAPRMAMFHDSQRPPPEERQGPNRMIRMLLNMDNPDHRAYRNLAKGWFTPGALKRLERRIEDIAQRILDEVARDGASLEFDFVARVAARLPLKVIAEILGVPEQDEDLVLQLSNQGIGSQDEEFRAEGLTPRDSSRAALRGLFDYFAALVEERRRAPRDDLASVLANATLGGKHLPVLELLSYFGLIAVAGHETTRNATSGGLAAFLARPDQWEKLRANPTLVRPAVEEIVRWTSPVIQFTRTAAEDVERCGETIRRGELLVLFYPSANRDEAVFPDGDVFRIDRDPNPHLGFGIGEHFCLGANLARLELRVMFRQLAERVQVLEPAGAPEWLASSFVGGIKHLPVRWRLRSAAA